VVYAVDAKSLKMKWKNTINEYTGLQTSEPISLVFVANTTLGKSRGISIREHRFNTLSFTTRSVFVGIIIAGSKAMASEYSLYLFCLSYFTDPIRSCSWNRCEYWNVSVGQEANYDQSLRDASQSPFTRWYCDSFVQQQVFRN